MKVSIVIRNRNEAEHLERVCRALSLQSLQPLELVIVDNESVDRSKEVARKYAAKLVHIRKSEFTYGRALNLGIRECEGEFVVLLSAHSLPLGRGFIETAIAPLADPRVAAVRCTMASKIPELERWTEPAVLSWPADIFTVVQNGPIASGCALRKDVWREIPFDETLEAVEDKLWALEALKKGYVIVHTEALYLHMRRRGFLESIRIMNREHLALFRATGYRWPLPETSFWRLLKAMALSAPQKALQVALREALIYGYLKTIPLQAKRKRRVGSLI